jgi:phosphatidylserine/phosphatidylglycerophosphate/cardiolipin synthase-like enzyme
VVGRLLLLLGLGVISLGQSAQLEVQFNRNNSRRYVDPYRGFTRSGINQEKQWINAIQNAQTRVWVAAYELRLPLLAKALAEAYHRGVDVRLITDNQNNYTLEKLPEMIAVATEYQVSRLKDYFAYVDLNQDGILSKEELEKMDAMRIIKKAQVPMIDDTQDGSAGSGIMHHKFILIDNDLLFTGSGNFTWSDIHGDKLRLDTRGNANNFLKIQNTEVHGAFAQEFRIMWGSGPSGAKSSRFGSKKTFREPLGIRLDDGAHLTLQFGATNKQEGWDQSANGLINKYLKKASHTLRGALFVWSKQIFSDTLINKDIDVEIFVDAAFGYRYYSELLDLLGVEMPTAQCRMDANNNPWSKPSLKSGIVNLQRGDILHHKFAVIDSKWVITGSQNWSANANNTNDEVVLIIEDNHVASQYEEEIKVLGNFALRGVTNSLKSRIKASYKNCGIDSPN